MSRVGVCYLLALAIGACNSRPLANTPSAPRDAAIVDAISLPEIDGPIKLPPVADAWPPMRPRTFVSMRRRRTPMSAPPTPGPTVPTPPR